MIKNNDISMKKISELTGVSIATVSRVINNNGRFSEETRELVQSVIKKYNYTPSIMAKGLRTKKVQNIGIIVPDITNEFFAKITLFIQKRLFENAYSTLIYNTDELEEMEREFISILIAQNVSGIIYISGGERGSIKTDIPTIYMDRKPSLIEDDINCINIESDNVEGGYIATKELLERGCRKPALLMDKRQLSSQIGRFLGYQKALWEHGINIDEKYIIKVDKVDFSTACSEIDKFIEKKYDFDGIFCTTDWLAMGAIKALLKNNIVIPDQVKVVGFDNISISEFGIRPFTTIDQDIEAMGELAASMIIKMINNEKLDKTNYILPVSLVRRTTT